MPRHQSKNSLSGLGSADPPLCGQGHFPQAVLSEPCCLILSAVWVTDRLFYPRLLRLCWVLPLSMTPTFFFYPICSAKCWLPAFLVNPWCDSCWFGWPYSLLSIVWFSARSVVWGMLEQREGIYSTPFGKKNCFFVKVRVANRCPLSSVMLFPG